MNNNVAGSLEAENPRLGLAPVGEITGKNDASRHRVISTSSVSRCACWPVATNSRTPGNVNKTSTIFAARPAQATRLAGPPFSLPNPSSLHRLHHHDHQRFKPRPANTESPRIAISHATASPKPALSVAPNVTQPVRTCFNHIASPKKKPAENRSGGLRRDMTVVFRFKQLFFAVSARGRTKLFLGPRDSNLPLPFPAFPFPADHSRCTCNFKFWSRNLVGAKSD